MTTTTASPSSQPSGRWLSALALVVAGSAAALGVVAITTDDISEKPAQIVVDPPAPIPADDVEQADPRGDAAAVSCHGQARLQIPCFE
jgi:hypothetical protein